MPKTLFDHLLLVLMGSNIGLQTISRVARLIAVDADFNLWFLEHAKTSRLDDDLMLQLLEDSEVINNGILHATTSFLSDSDWKRFISRTDRSEDNYRELMGEYMILIDRSRNR